jgi:hypothetical protein
LPASQSRRLDGANIGFREGLLELQSMPMRHVSVLPALVLAVTLGGCVQSEKPVFGPESRVLPFALPATFEVYNRMRPDDPWVARGRRLVADDNRVVRSWMTPERSARRRP